MVAALATGFTNIHKTGGICRRHVVWKHLNVFTGPESASRVLVRGTLIPHFHFVGLYRHTTCGKDPMCLNDCSSGNTGLPTWAR